ncbi:hypothetical protein [Saliphagus infecundisoli]|uniref:Uncharacterized protein n=1 Tax=Saliphagus infecundisoli TaxID=1849069 RepID=A0ABD5QI71_9EURY|nr:hypothetical protein [Saliphagus infecundisoli]
MTTAGETDEANGDEPTALLRDLITDWCDRKAEYERQADTADSDGSRRLRGRTEALSQGINRLQAADLEEEPFRSVGKVRGRLHSRTGELGRLIDEGAPLEEKHRAIREELTTMMEELNQLRERLDETLDDDQLPHPDDWEWVNDEVRERVLEAWGYDS